ncbi:MAG: hypothetical protein ABI551_18215 [Polyangiaceae bacterium]
MAFRIAITDRTTKRGGTLRNPEGKVEAMASQRTSMRGEGKLTRCDVAWFMRGSCAFSPTAAQIAMLRSDRWHMTAA